MSSTPNSSIGSEIKTPPYMLDHASNSNQPPYGLRSNAILSLPPPQNALLAASSQMYSHPMNFSGQAAGNSAINSTNKNVYLRMQTTDAMNYPSLNQPTSAGNGQGFQQLSQAALQNLPQNNYSLSHPAYSQSQEKANQAYASQAPFHGYASQVQHSQNQHASQGLDMQNTNTLSAVAPQPHAAASTDQFTMPQTGHLNHEAVYAHIAKFMPKRRPTVRKTLPHTNKFSILPSPVPNTLKPFVCTYEGCHWAFARQSDLRRHTKSHVTPAFHCPYWKNDPTCHRNGGSFSRLDVLKRHLRLIHFIKDKQRENENEDPGWCRACQKLFPSSKSFIEHCEACSRLGVSAEWKGNVAGESVPTMNQ